MQNFLKIGLNQIILHWRFFLFQLELASTSFSLKLLFCKAFSYKGFELSNIFLDDDISDNVFSIDFGSYFNVFGG